MKRLKKTIFLHLVVIIVGVLFVIRLVVNPTVPAAASPVDDASESVEAVEALVAEDVPSQVPSLFPAPTSLDFSYKHRLRGVHSYDACFNDLQDVQMEAALRNGVGSIRDRAEAEARKDELVYVGDNPFYRIDPGMKSSIPYLVPRASMLLQHISRRFLDSLAVKQIPLHTIIVTSVLRTEEDVVRLRRVNVNAADQSCHCLGTTFDIAYTRYHAVSPPDEPQRRTVRDDTLKYVLSEVLRDAREAGYCYVKHERKQGCFHITVR